MERALKLRRVEEKDLGVIASWYEKRGTPFPPRWMRGDMGFLVEQKGIPLASAYLIRTGAGFCLCEHLQTDPEILQVSRGKAVKFLIECLQEVVKSLGYQYILGFVPESQRTLRRFYPRIGFLTSEARLQGFYKEV